MGLSTVSRYSAPWPQRLRGGSISFKPTSHCAGTLIIDYRRKDLHYDDKNTYRDDTYPWAG